MTDRGLSEEQKYKNMCNEVELVGKAHDLLNIGTFPGHLSMEVTTCRMYLQSMYKSIKAQADKLAPLPLPDVVKEVPASAQVQ